MLLIDAVYIHESGGKTLLEYFVRSAQESDIPYYLLLDERLSSIIADDLVPGQYKKVKASEKARKEFYRLLPENITSIFCFANVPPPVKIVGKKVFILFHNVLLVSPLTARNRYSLKKKLSFLLKRWYIRFHIYAHYEWVVQTPFMKRNVMQALSINANRIHILPFFEEVANSPSDLKHIPDTFLYVADGVPQKNHRVLLEAWEILLKEYHLKPQLHLTVPDRFHELLHDIEARKARGCKIINHSSLNKAALNELYQTCNTLVFPSLAESFGLPLIEAARAGCYIIAADSSYIYDVIKPGVIFDPYNADDLAAAIKKANPNPSELMVQDYTQQLINLVYQD